jgi:hypothetical protein
MAHPRDREISKIGRDAESLIVFDATDEEPKSWADGTPPHNVYNRGSNDTEYSVGMYLAKAPQELGVFRDKNAAMRFADVCLLRLSRYKKRRQGQLATHFNYSRELAHSDYTSNFTVKDTVDRLEMRIVELLNVEPISDKLCESSEALMRIEERLRAIQTLLFQQAQAK